MSDAPVDIRGFKYAIVPEWLIYSECSSAAVRVFMILYRHGGQSGAIYPSRARLAKLSGCSTASVDRYIKELVDIGAVTIRQRFLAEGGQTSNGYTLNMAHPGDTNEIPSEESAHQQRIGGVLTDEEPPLCTSDERKRVVLKERSSKEIPPTRDFASLNLSTVGARHAKKAVAILTDEQRQKLIDDFHDLPDVRETIALALSHEAARKYSDQYLYVRNWLRRERNGRPGRSDPRGGGRPPGPPVDEWGEPYCPDTGAPHGWPTSDPDDRYCHQCGAQEPEYFSLAHPQGRYRKALIRAGRPVPPEEL